MSIRAFGLLSGQVADASGHAMSFHTEPEIKMRKFVAHVSFRFSAIAAERS